MPVPVPAQGMRPGIQNHTDFEQFINLYNAIAKKILDYKDKRKELTDILDAVMQSDAMPEGQRDQAITFNFDGPRTKEWLLKEFYMENPETMNPFTFFAFFNTYVQQGGLYNNWSAWIRGVCGSLGVTAEIPESEDGLPVGGHYPCLFPDGTPNYFSVLDGWFQGYRNIQLEDTVNRLWNLAEYAASNQPPDPNDNTAEKARFRRDFNLVTPLLNMNTGLMSGGLNWMNPGVWIRANYIIYRDYYQVFNENFLA